MGVTSSCRVRELQGTAHKKPWDWPVAQLSQRGDGKPGAGQGSDVSHERPVVRDEGHGKPIAHRPVPVATFDQIRGGDGQGLAGTEGGGTLVIRGVEFGAAGLVLLFGVGLLFGYLAAERVTCL